jgi:hypothetical protein
VEVKEGKESTEENNKEGRRGLKYEISNFLCHLHPPVLFRKSPFHKSKMAS